MPSHSTLNSEEKDKIKKAIQSGKIVAAAIARIYYAYPEPDEWSYSGVEGALVFGTQDSGFWLRMVDLGGTRGVIWEHEFYDGMDFNQDRTFFFSFAGDDCMIGIAFSDEKEASELNKKIGNRRTYAAKQKRSKPAFSGFGNASMPSMPNFSPPGKSKEKKSKSKSGGFLSKITGAFSFPDAGFGASDNKSDRASIASISEPSDPQHVNHVSINKQQGGLNTQNVDPEMEALIQQLLDMGVSPNAIDKEFIESYMASVNGADDAADTAPPPSHAPPPLPGLSPAAAAHAPTRAPPFAPGVPAPPPPPPAGRAPSAPAAPPPPPPGPPTGRAPNAPPPPPPPGGRSAVPPPPPPAAPPARSAAPPVPPTAPIPPAQDGRGALLASIRGAGVGQLKKVDPAAAAAGGAAIGAGGALAAHAAMPGTPDAVGGGEQNNLAAALAAALTVRRAGTGESDDEAESDDDEW